MLFEHNINNNLHGTIGQKNKPIVLNSWHVCLRVIDVKNANAYVIIDDAIKKFEKNIQVLKFIMRQGLERKIIQNG